MNTEQQPNTESLADAELEPPTDDEGIVVGDESATVQTERAQSSRLRRMFTLNGRLGMPRRKRARIAAVVLLVLCLSGAGGGYVWWQSGQLPEGVAFRVGDTMVSVDELKRDMDTLRALYGVERPEDTRRLDQFWRDAAKAQAITRILDDAARERNIVVSDKRARDVLSRYIAAQIGDGPAAYEEFVRAIGNAGTSEAKVLAEIKRQLALSQLFDQVTKGQKVSDAEVRDAFAQRRDALGTPERRKLSNIVVRTKGQAKQVLRDLKEGASFAALAKRRSLDASTRDKGGALGAVRQEQLGDNYGKAAFAAGQGEVFGPIKNKFGWNVGKVMRVLEPVPAEFESSKDRLKDILRVERQMKVWREWLSEQIKSADVEYAERYKPAEPDALPDDSVVPTEPPR